MSIPKDGYYTAWVQLDTGGALPAYIRVQDGVIRDSDGDELRLDACTDFHPVSTQQFCGVWPKEAAMELEALRTANAGLVEKIRGLEAARTQAAANSLANMLSYEELEAKVEAKVKRLEEAGDVMAKLIPFAIGDDEDESWANHMMSYNKARCRGAVENWIKAKGQP